MRGPLENGPWVELDVVDSTQREMARLLAEGTAVGVLLAHDQIVGEGRFGRRWVSEPGRSMTLSMNFAQYGGHREPWLLGMAVALAAAEVLDVSVRWPNDLVAEGKKLGGVLVQLLPTPIVGMGINVAPVALPDELAPHVTSLVGLGRQREEPLALGRRIVEALAAMPEPESWPALAPRWSARDRTEGKAFTLPDGRVARATGVGPHGELSAEVDGEPIFATAAEAMLGHATR